MENINHDALQLAVHFFEAPAETFAVLAHFQRGGGNTAGICSFSGNEQDTVLLQILGSFQSGGHISAFTYCLHPICNKAFRIGKGKLILGRAGKGDFHLNAPYAFAGMIFRIGSVIQIIGYSSAFYFLDFFQRRKINSFRIIYPAGGIRTGYYLCAHLLSLLDSINCHISGTGNCDGLACDIDAVAFKHFFCHV